MRRLSLTLEDEVRQLPHLDLQQLRAVWARQFGPAPKLRSVELLRLMLAWRMQSAALGGLDAGLRQQITRKGKVVTEGQSLGHGAVLRRIWQGRIIEAVVEADGFRHDGQRYRSLSAVAQAATGTRWNGPRFFGLRQDAEP
jgi:hypothetical protein